MGGWIFACLILFCQDVTAKLFVSDVNDKLSYPEALLKCQERGMYLLNARSDFADEDHAELDASMRYNKAEFWFSKSSRKRRTYRINSRCWKVTVQRYEGGCYDISGAHSDLCFNKYRYICEGDDSDELRQDGGANWSHRSFSPRRTVDWFKRFTHGVFHGWS